jgi:hypothetical protein
MHDSSLITHHPFAGVGLYTALCTSCVVLFADVETTTCYITVLDTLLLLLDEIEVASVFTTEVLAFGFESTALMFAGPCLGFRLVFDFTVGTHTGFLHSCVATPEELGTGDLTTVK